jgi:exodeoxyribonuclease VII small subunit
MPSKKEAPQEPKFEEAMARLEAVVDEMESGKLPLEDLLRRYEEGVRLVKLCGTTLDAAEQRIRTIARDAAGAPVVSDAGASAEPTPRVAPENSDVSLF